MVNDISIHNIDPLKYKIKCVFIYVRDKLT